MCPEVREVCIARRNECNRKEDHDILGNNPEPYVLLRNILPEIKPVSVKITANMMIKIQKLLSAAIVLAAAHTAIPDHAGLTPPGIGIARADSLPAAILTARSDERMYERYRNHSARTPVTATTDSDMQFSRAFSQRKSNLQLEGKGTVIKNMPDDKTGSRHQRFVIRLDSGQTLMIAHNIDLAPRIDSLQTGDVITFYGEYEWSPKGGIIHWTHADPRNYHVAGWIRHNGQLYQ